MLNSWMIRNARLAIGLATGLVPILAFAKTAESSKYPLTAGTPIVLSGPPGEFDFMGVDQTMQRVLAAHEGCGTLELLDLVSGKPMKALAFGDAKGLAVDAEGHRYFIGNDSAHSVVVVDAKSLAKVSEIKVDGPVDAMAYNQKNGMLYAARDDGDHLWVIDVKRAKVVATISIPGMPEGLEFDPQTNHLYLELKDKGSIIRIDPTTNKIDATWPVLPATDPYGLALDIKRGRAYVAGTKGKISALDLKSGKILSTAPIAPGVDHIAFDPVKQVIYSACVGAISITKVADSGLEPLGRVASPNGAHSLVIVPATHEVWISYADKNHSYLQKFSPAAE